MEQEHTLNSPRRRYGLPARVLFTLMDTVYGKERSLEKFKVLEIVARVPYQSWEVVSYIAITHMYPDRGFAKEMFDRVKLAREAQDNEQYHLLILEDILQQRGKRASWVKRRLLPQVIAIPYYYTTWLMTALRPRWAFALNADFEDHAEHEYMGFVADHPEFDETPVSSVFFEDYGEFATLGDLLRQIGLDERHHKEDSLEWMRRPTSGGLLERMRVMRKLRREGQRLEAALRDRADGTRAAYPSSATASTTSEE
jgi:demethoxyubiquinone hydroxylase (CLK1/Coq7/Cat5 family)